jgi:hypothetical protein
MAEVRLRCGHSCWLILNWLCMIEDARTFTSLAVTSMFMFMSKSMSKHHLLIYSRYSSFRLQSILFIPFNIFSKSHI